MYIKKFKQFLNEDTVYSTGLGHDLRIYSDKPDKNFYDKCIKILEDGKWKSSEVAKLAFSEAERIAEMWNSTPEDKWPVWAKSGPYTWELKDGKPKAKNFLSVSKIILAVSNMIVEPVKADSVDHEFRQNRCFEYSIKWSKQNSGKAIGGICAPLSIEKVYTETIVVHAFCEKDARYYDPTFGKDIAKKLIYYPFFEYNGTSDREFSEMCWQYALGIEKAVKQFLDI